MEAKDPDQNKLKIRVVIKVRAVRADLTSCPCEISAILHGFHEIIGDDFAS